MSKSEIKEEYGLVVLLDVLGVKGIWRYQKPGDVLEKWSQFTKVIEQIFKGLEKENQLKTSFNVFSDTIIITLTGDLEKGFSDFSGMIHAFLHAGIFLDLPMRGAISLGPFYKSEKMILGPTIDECSQFYTLPDCIGIICSPSYQSFLERMEKNSEMEFLVDIEYVRWDVPIKDNKTLKNFFMLRLNGSTKILRSAKKDYPEVENIHEFIHYKLEHLTNVEASIKLKNTLQLINHSKPKES